ncbi:GNAT family N-acetyltransferase [Micromonospora sp. NPDC049836]|uniref:GNAT family N-acetyltransferase n=1 Tax=Micromonospora sp. NPDC049836 TaxID=3364274 RepID=UPI00379A75E1
MTIADPRWAVAAAPVRSLQNPTDSDTEAVVTLLREAVPTTCAGLVPYYAAGFGPYLAAALTPPTPCRTVFIRYVRAGGDICAVADWRLLGTCLFLNGIAVATQQRGQRHGSRLLGDGERLGRLLGCDTLALDVSTTNPAARRLYERHGFVERTYAEWLRVCPKAAGKAEVRLLDWPSFAAHRSAYGFGDVRAVRRNRDHVVRVIGRALRVPADEDGPVLAAVLSVSVGADQAFAVRSTSASSPSSEAFVHFTRMNRALTAGTTG